MFWQRPKPPSRPNRQRLAVGCGLRSEPHAAPILRTVLGLDGRLALGTIYNLPLERGAELYFLEYDSQEAGPRGVRPGWISLFVILTCTPLSPATLRVTHRQSELLESLGAAGGGKRVRVPHAGEFDERLSLYTRDEAAALGLMTAPVRGTLLTALSHQADDISFSLGEKQLLLSVRPRVASTTRWRGRCSPTCSTSIRSCKNAAPLGTGRVRLDPKPAFSPVRLAAR